MGVVGDRGAAVGTVIEYKVVRERAGQVQHIGETPPDGLGGVDVAGYYQVVGEDGGPVHQDVVFAAFPSLEGERVLVLHVILFAQRAAVVEDGEPSRVGLQGNLDSVHFERSCACAFEGAVFGRYRGPYGKLVVDEFVDIGCHLTGGKGVWFLFWRILFRKRE